MITNYNIIFSILIKSLYLVFFNLFWYNIHEFGSDNYMKKIILVDGIKCDKCVSRIKKKLENIDNIKNVLVNLNTKEVTIEYNKEIELDKIYENINNLGFNVIDIK